MAALILVRVAGRMILVNMIVTPIYVKLAIMTYARVATLIFVKLVITAHARMYALLRERPVAQVTAVTQIYVRVAIMAYARVATPKYVNPV